MNSKIVNVLKRLTDNGYDAYVVGGYVRDYLLGNISNDIDIATSATPKEVISLFDILNSNEDNYGSISIKDSNLNFDITTFRVENGYEDRHPSIVKYTQSLEDDVLRRDFTINAIYMNANGELIDPLNGQRDIKLKLIRIIGDNSRLVEDPLRIMRAIRFSSVLDFSLDDSLFNYIKENRALLLQLSKNRIKEELDIIFKSPNCIKGLKLIEDLDLKNVLGIEYNNVKSSSNLLGIWAQIEYSSDYLFKKSDSDKINDIRKILKYGTIDNMSLYQYGLYLNVIAGEILKFDTSFISLIYKDLPIYSVKDIAVNGDDIMNILNLKASSIIKKILSDLEINILNGLLNNTFDDIKKYLIENWSDINE